MQLDFATMYAYQRDVITQTVKRMLNVGSETIGLYIRVRISSERSHPNSGVRKLDLKSEMNQGRILCCRRIASSIFITMIESSPVGQEV